MTTAKEVVCICIHNAPDNFLFPFLMSQTNMTFNIACHIVIIWGHNSSQHTNINSEQKLG